MTLTASELKPPVAPPEPKPTPPPDHVDKKPSKEAEPAKKTGEKNYQTHEYSAELPPLPGNTSHALDKSLKGLIAENLVGEQRKSIGQATLPFAIGAAAEVTRNHSWLFGTMSQILHKGPGTALGKMTYDLGQIAGLGAQLQNAVSTFAAVGGSAAIVTGVLSPTMSIMKRALLGENAWKQAASFMVRKEDGGLLSRIIHGGESRLMKWSMFRENRARRQLLRLADQKVDVKDLVLGNRGKIEDLIAEGMVAGATSQMMTELGVPLSPRDQEKRERLNRAYDMARQIFDAKIPTAGQKEIFINDKLPELVRNKERVLWATQTALITGVGVLKSVSMVGLLQTFTHLNINHMIERGKDLVIGAGNFIEKTTPIKAGTWVAQVLGRGAGGVPIILPPVVGPPPVVPPVPFLKPSPWIP